MCPHGVALHRPMGHLSEGVTLSGTGRGQERHLDKVIGSWEIKKDMEDKVK